MASTKTTDKHFQLFTDYVHFWQRELGLTDWKIYVFHKKPEPDSFATTYTSSTSHAARVNFALEWVDRPVNENNLKECALHEVMHIVTAVFYNEASARYTMEDDVGAAEHALVIRMTDYIMRLHATDPAL